MNENVFRVNRSLRVQLINVDHFSNVGGDINIWLWIWAGPGDVIVNIFNKIEHVVLLTQ